MKRFERVVGSDAVPGSVGRETSGVIRLLIIKSAGEAGRLYQDIMLFHENNVKNFGHDANCPTNPVISLQNPALRVFTKPSAEAVARPF